MRLSAALLAASVSLVAHAPTNADDLRGVELNVTFYLQPDSTGNNTQNKSIEYRRGRIEIEESGEDRNRLEKFDADEDDVAALLALIKGRIQGFEFSAAEDFDPPYVEVEFEFDGDARTIEMEQVYPTGKVPAELLDLQKKYFNSVFE